MAIVTQRAEKMNVILLPGASKKTPNIPSIDDNPSTDEPSQGRQ